MRPTDGLANRPTDQPTNQQTDMRVHREVTIPIIVNNHWFLKYLYVNRPKDWLMIIFTLFLRTQHLYKSSFPLADLLTVWPNPTHSPTLPFLRRDRCADPWYDKLNKMFNISICTYITCSWITTLSLCKHLHFWSTFDLFPTLRSCSAPSSMSLGL